MVATNLGSGVMDCETIRKRHLADEYRAGRLTAEEAEDYERHFFACDRCFADLRLRDHVAERLSEEGSSLFADEAGREKSRRGEREVSGWRGLLDPAWLRSAGVSLALRAGAVAVVAVLAVFAIGRLSDQSSEFRDLWTPTAHPYVASELRGDAGAVEFRSGMEAYVAGRYEEAVDRLRRSAETGSPNGEVSFYLGVSLLMLDDAEAAEAALQRAIEHMPSSALYRWYLAQAKLKQGRVKAAEAELGQIADGGGQYAYEARSLLQRIAEIRD